MAERGELGILRRKGYSLRDVAHALGRAVSTISDEIARNSVSGTYNSRKAHHKAYVRRKYSKYQGMRIVHHPKLREYVEQLLLDDIAPEQIAGRLWRVVREVPYVSGNTIRRFIASVYGRRIETHRWLRRIRGKHRRGRRASLPPRTFIDRRPQYINARSRVGDAETDFIASGKSGKGILLVLVDRKTRHTFLERILPVSIPRMEEGFFHIKGRFPELRTLTTDNDILFRHHERLAALLHVRIFFCHPYHAWEKGSIENANKIIRRDIPKGSDISRYPPRIFRTLEEKLNRRPMACLGYRTPSEMLAQHRRRMRKQKHSARECSD